MEPIITDKESTVSPDAAQAKPDVQVLTPQEEIEHLFRLGSWLAGLKSFMSGGSSSFGESQNSTAKGGYIHELRLARAALHRCSFMIFEILHRHGEGSRDESLGGTAIKFDELRRFSGVLREPIQLAESLHRGESVTLAEWQAWCRVSLDRFAADSTFHILDEMPSLGGLEITPQRLRELVARVSFDLSTDLEIILPRFSRILRQLEIIGLMLERDEPLKPAMVIFSKIGEMTQKLIGDLNRRVSHAANAEDEFTATLDRASYTASIELKRVLRQELSGLTATRPPTIIYARAEAAHALLTESFQNILAGFARGIDPTIEAFDMFPSFGSKRERSIKLRADLHNVLVQVQAAEKKPSPKLLSDLKVTLLKYMDESLNYLFYKDTETFERFVDEVLIARRETDLVPILHRFGAYLETLFAQVNMRAVLEKHPFQEVSG